MQESPYAASWRAREEGPGLADYGRECPAGAVLNTLGPLLSLPQTERPLGHEEVQGSADHRHKRRAVTAR